MPSILVHSWIFAAYSVSYFYICAAAQANTRDGSLLSRVVLLSNDKTKAVKHLPHLEPHVQPSHDVCAGSKPTCEF